MKAYFLLVCISFLVFVNGSKASSVGAPYYPLNPEDLSDGDIKELEYWDNYYHRPKRTLEPALGSAGLIIRLKTAALKGTKMKIVEIARGSIGAALGASGGAVRGAGGAVLGSIGAVNQLKSALSHEIQRKIGQIVKTSASAVVATSSGAGKSAFGAVSGSANAINQLKSAAFNGLTSKIGQIAQGSAGLATAASSNGGKAIAGSANAINQLKEAAINEITNKLGEIARGSAGIAAGASTGIKHKVQQVSGDIVTGGIDVANQLKHAIAAGTKQKLGQAASGFAGAITGAVGSASAGIGQITRGVVSGSSNLFNQVKAGVLRETQKKLGNVANASGQFTQSAGRTIQGSADGINQLKSSLIAGLKQHIWQLASGSTAALAGASGDASRGASSVVSGSAGAVKQLKNALFTQISHNIDQASDALNQLKAGIVSHLTNKINQVARGSISASGQASRSTGSLVSGSGEFINQLKASLLSKATQVAQGSLSAATGASGQASKGVNQLKSSLLSTVVQAAQGSASSVTSTSGQALNAANQLKSAALTHLTSKVGQLARGSLSAASGASGQAGSAVQGSANAVHQLKTAALTQLTSKVKQVVSGSTSAVISASGQASKGGAAAIQGSASAINQLKSAALSQVTNKIGQASRGAVGASGQLSSSAGSAASGSAQAVFQLKASALRAVHNTLQGAASSLASGSEHVIEGSAETSVERKKRSADWFLEETLQSQHSDEVETDLPKRAESAWSTGSGSGSADIIGQLKSAVISGLKQKIGQVARGSAGAVAGASAGFSKGSFGGDSKGYHSYHSYGPPSSDHHHDDEHKSINVWDLKKSVLNTLLQAVKAIKGGVLAIKGQLIKGSGYVVSGGGKLIAASGDKVTSLGKNIINNAVLVHPDKTHHSHSDYGSHSSSYAEPSGPPIVYDAPSSSGHGYESHYEDHGSYHNHNDKQHGPHAGILILRRIPPTSDKYHSAHSHLDTSVYSTGPTFGNVVGKFFTASTSLNPADPSPFTNGDIHPYHHHGDDHHVAEDSHGVLNPPNPPHFEEPRHTHEAAAASFQATLSKEHEQFGANVPQSSSALADNYGVPFEDPLKYQNSDHYGASASTNTEQKVKLTKGEILDHLEGSPSLATSQVRVGKDTTDRPVGTLEPPFNSDYLPTNYHSQAHELLQSQSTNLNPIHSLLNDEKDSSSSLSSSKEILPPNSPLSNFLPQEDPITFSGSQEVTKGLSSKESYMKFVERFPFRKSYLAPAPAYKVAKSSQKARVKRVKVTDTRHKRPSTRPDFSVMKSVSYEITPHGAKRLT